MTDFKLDFMRQYRRNVLTKVVRQLGVTKAGKDRIFTDEVLDKPVICSEILADEYEFYDQIYAGHVEKINLQQLVVPAKFEKSNIYSEYMAGQNLIEEKLRGKYIMAMHMKSVIWLVYEEDGYDGNGACIVKTDNESFVLEPIDNYLTYTYPRREME